VDISSKINETLTQLISKGFSGDNIYLAGHSLGGVFAQEYIKSNWNIDEKSQKALLKIKGLILMGSVLIQSSNTITPSGSSIIDFPVPTLTLNGELDGLLRITRSAVSYWHQTHNIDSSQTGQFTTLALEGFNHSNFMDSALAPDSVTSFDLKSEISEDESEETLSELIVDFMQSLPVQDKYHSFSEAL